MSARAPSTSSCRLAQLGFLILILAMWPMPAEARRVALIIGNGAYSQLPALANPTRDARLVGQAFLQSGFDRVEIRTDLDLAGMRQALQRFRELASGAETAVIYFAGHGVETGGQNWLLPTGIQIRGSGDIASQAVPMPAMMDALNRVRGLRVLIIDACRTNPFERRPGRAQFEAASRRLVTRSLAAVESASVLVFYAAKAGTPALDGIGENSPFATALARHISAPGVDVRRLFGQVREEVLRVTENQQEPFTYGTAPAEGAQFVPANLDAVLADADELGWSRATGIDTEDAHQDYLRLFPSGRRWNEAGARYARLRAQRIRRGASDFTGRTLTVATTGRANFRTLADALNAARDGDRVLLAPGEHRTGQLSIRKRVLIAASAAGRGRTILLASQAPDRILSAFSVSEGGLLRMDGISVRCTCRSVFFVVSAEIILNNVDVVQTGFNSLTETVFSMGQGSRATLVDSAIHGGWNTLSGGGAELVAVGNDIGLPFSVSGHTGLLVDNRMGGPAHYVARFSGDGRTLLAGNRIDARNVTPENAFTTFALFALTYSSGRIELRSNQIQPPPNFTEQQWLDCTSSLSCDFIREDNQLGPAQPPARPVNRRRRTRR